MKKDYTKVSTRKTYTTKKESLRDRVLHKIVTIGSWSMLLYTLVIVFVGSFLEVSNHTLELLCAAWFVGVIGLGLVNNWIEGK